MVYGCTAYEPKDAEDEVSNHFHPFNQVKETTLKTTKQLNLEKYNSDGWGLSNAAFNALQKVMDTLPEIIAIEFGSGFSSQFLLDYAASTKKSFISTPLTMMKNSSIQMQPW